MSHQVKHCLGLTSSTWSPPPLVLSLTSLQHFHVEPMQQDENSSPSFHQRGVMTFTCAPPDSRRKMSFEGKVVAGTLQLAEQNHHLRSTQLQSESFSFFASSNIMSEKRNIWSSNPCPNYFISFHCRDLLLQSRTQFISHNLHVMSY